MRGWRDVGQEEWKDADAYVTCRKETTNPLTSMHQ